MRKRTVYNDSVFRPRFSPSGGNSPEGASMKIAERSEFIFAQHFRRFKEPTGSFGHTLLPLDALKLRSSIFYGFSPTMPKRQ